MQLENGSNGRQSLAGNALGRQAHLRPGHPRLPGLPAKPGQHTLGRPTSNASTRPPFCPRTCYRAPRQAQQEMPDAGSPSGVPGTLAPLDATRGPAVTSPSSRCFRAGSLDSLPCRPAQPRLASPPQRPLDLTGSPVARLPAYNGVHGLPFDDNDTDPVHVDDEKPAVHAVPLSRSSRPISRHPRPPPGAASRRLGNGP